METTLFITNGVRVFRVWEMWTEQEENTEAPCHHEIHGAPCFDRCEFPTVEVLKSFVGDDVVTGETKDVRFGLSSYRPVFADETLFLDLQGYVIADTDMFSDRRYCEMEETF